MRWEDLRTSNNIEDDREASASRGGGLGIPGGGGGLGIGMVIILGLIGWALGIDPSVLIGGAQILTVANNGTAPVTYNLTSTAANATSARIPSSRPEVPGYRVRHMTGCSGWYEQ